MEENSVTVSKSVKLPLLASDRRLKHKLQVFVIDFQIVFLGKRFGVLNYLSNHLRLAVNDIGISQIQHAG